MVVAGRCPDESARHGRKQTGPNPTDRGKRGVKRRLLTDANGLPLAVAIDGADRHDMKLTPATLEGIIVPRPTPTPETPQGLRLDAGYDYGEVCAIAEEWASPSHIRPRGEEAEAIQREPGFKANNAQIYKITKLKSILIDWGTANA